MKDTMVDKKYSPLMPSVSTAPRSFAKPNWGSMMNDRNGNKPLNVPEPHTTIDYSKQGFSAPNEGKIGFTGFDLRHETTNARHYHPNLLKREGGM